MSKHREEHPKVRRSPMSYTEYEKEVEATVDQLVHLSDKLFRPMDRLGDYKYCVALDEIVAFHHYLFQRIDTYIEKALERENGELAVVSAIEAITELQLTKYSEIILHKLKFTNSCLIRIKCALALAELRYSVAIPELERQFFDPVNPDFEEYYFAHALVFLGKTEYLSSFSRAINSAHDNIQILAMNALVEFISLSSREEVASKLQQVLANPATGRVAAEAERLLVALNSNA